MAEVAAIAPVKRRRLGVLAGIPRITPLVAMHRSACHVCCGEMFGRGWRRSNAAPETIGQEYDVPEPTRISELLPMPAPCTALPGAFMSTHGP